MADHLHPQVLIRHGDREAHVDERLADLIVACWQSDWETTNSCQDNHGRVWIGFLFGIDAGQFCTVCAGGFDPDIEGLHNRVSGEWEPADCEAFRAERAWQYSCGPFNFAGPVLNEATDEMHDPPPGTPSEIVISVSIRFPPSDLAEVTRRVQAHAQAFSAG